jgi:hypothetical protein
MVFTLSREEKKLNATSNALPETADAPSKISKRQSLKKSKYQTHLSAKSLNTFPKECDSPLSDLAAMTDEEYKDLILNKDAFIIFLGDKCSEKLTENSNFKELVTNSQCRLFEDKNDGTKGSCLTMMFMLRAYFIADYTSGKTPEEMTSQELAANFVKMFFSIDKLTKDSFLAFIQVK